MTKFGAGRGIAPDIEERELLKRLHPDAKRLYRRRQQTVERSFADGKELHGHRYARMRGLAKVAEQCLLSAACQNMKKMALLLTRKGGSGGGLSALVAGMTTIWRGWRRWLRIETANGFLAAA